MIALTDAVIQLLITEVTALGGRVFDGIARMTGASRWRS